MDSDDDFEFNTKSNFDKNQERMQQQISNSQNFNLFKEISANFLTNLSNNTTFDHQYKWRGYTSTEPISIKISSFENTPGICDIVEPTNTIFFRKVVITLSSLFSEIDNILSTPNLNPFETLYPLAMYNETIDSLYDDQQNISGEEGAEQMTRMLNYLRELYERIINLLSLAICLFNQLIALYTKESNIMFETLYKNVHFDVAFDYVGLILAYLNAVDCIVEEKDIIGLHWEAYRKIFYKSKANMAEYNMTEDQKNKLEKLINRITACVLEKSCFDQCIKNFLKNTGQYTPNLSGHNTPCQNPSFIREFVSYLKRKLNKLSEELGNITETDEKIQLFSTISLIGLYCKMVEIEKSKKISYDKDLLKLAWSVLQKTYQIPIVGHISIDLSKFLKKQAAFASSSYDIKDIVKKSNKVMDALAQSIPSIVSNFKIFLMSWLTKIESDMFEPKIPLSSESIKETNKKAEKSKRSIIEKNEIKVQNILNGLYLANFLRINISACLDYFVTTGKSISPGFIDIITTGLEIIKVVEDEYKKMTPHIAQDLDLINRALFYKLQEKLKQVSPDINKKISETRKHGLEYKDIKEACNMMFNSSMATPSKLRRFIMNLGLPMMTYFDEKAFSDIPELLDKIFTLNELTKEVRRACDCSFMFWYQEIIPQQITTIFKEKSNRIVYLIKSLNDVEYPLLHLIYQEDQGVNLIKQNRKELYKVFEDNFLKPLSVEIENDLRTQVHGVLIEKLNSTVPSDLNLSNMLKLEKFRMFDKLIDIKRYVEEYYNARFYKLTTINLNDWGTYQMIRVYAKSKYGLNLHEIFLPSQSLDQGRDIITIIRKLPSFVDEYCHNLLSQIFVQKITKKHETNSANIIGVNQILNSIYTNGPGIINSVINSTYQYLKQQLKMIVNLLSDDFIVSTLKDEKTFWQNNRENLGYNYPYQRAEVVKENLKKLFSDQSPLKLQLIQNVTHIGNAVALTHCIRTALRDYNSQNSNLINCDILENFGKLINNIGLEDEPEGAPQTNANFKNNVMNSFKDSTQMFLDTMSSLQQTGLNKVNYLTLLVNSFGNAFSPEKIGNIDLFIFLFPAACIKHIENLICAKKNLTMITNKNKQDDAYFCDDGFIIGMVYILKVFKCIKFFNNLNWFTSVIGKFEKDKSEFENSKNKGRKVDDGVLNNLKGYQSDAYLREMRACLYTYSSASVLFNE